MDREEGNFRTFTFLELRMDINWGCRVRRLERRNYGAGDQGIE